MKKIFAVILIILIGSSFAFSQIETPKTPDWQIFAPETEEFTIDVPVPLNASVAKNDPAKADLSRRYLNSIDGTYFYIFSDDPKKPWQFDFVSRFAKNSIQAGKTETIGEFETEKFTFDDNSDFHQTILTVKGKNRIYIFQTVSPTKENPLTDRFFSSLKLQGKSLITETPGNVVAQTPLSEKENRQVPGSSGNGRGEGSGSGTGNQNPPVQTPQTPLTTDKKTAGVKILAKPRALYTDLARFYEIQGKVVIRVTFSASGTIGAIAVISKLPFGLTEQAVIAVKGIKFEPAIREDVNYSVSRPVEYSFTIY